jgi:anaerobic selenocysteine-containing dehydrogenase
MKISRREFIKCSMMGTMGIAGLREIFPLLQTTKTNPNISPRNPLSLKSVPTTCLQCNSHCGILGFLEDNQLVSLYGNPHDPNSRGKLCAKGMAEINLIYDPERLLFPLRRVGKRGEGKWKRISWDEAYEEMAQTLKMIEKSGDWLFVETGREEMLTRRFLRALGTDRIFFNSNPLDSNARIARIFTWGEDTMIPDLSHAKYILNFGSNPYESHELYVPLIERLIESRITNRAKLVTFDVRLSHTAGQSDEWLPIFPGTDGIVALSMAQIIMKAGLFDQDFLKNWTNYPVDALKSYLSSFTPERAEKVSGLKREDIERIALEFARTKPAVAISGGGVSEHVNGTQNERCIMLLNALVGNIDRKGGYLLPRRLLWKEPSPQPPEKEMLENVSTIQEAFPIIKKENAKVGLYLSYLANPAYSNPECKSTIELLKDENFISRLIVIDTHLSETACLADIVLPAATYLENWGFDSPPSFDLTPFLTLIQPVIEPLGESRALRSTRTARLTEPVIKPRGEAVAWDDILIEVAKRIGGRIKDYFNFDSAAHFLKEVLNQFEDLKSRGGINFLKKYGVWVDPVGKEADYKLYRKKGFKTPSGKFEIYSSRIEELGFSPLPAYEPIRQPKKGEFVLVTFSPNVHTFRTSNCKWLSEIAHENSVWINKEVGQSMKIKEGDKVKIESEVGSITVKAHLTSGIHPRVVAISRGFGHWGYGSIAQGKRVESPDPDTHEVWWDNNGTNPNPIIPIKRDPIGKGQAWKDTRVKISKV